MKTRQLLFDRPLPDGWRVLKVDELKADEPSSCAAGPFGSNISSKYFVDEGIPVIRGANLRDDLTRFVPEGFVFVSEERATAYKGQHVRAGDLVFTCWGTLGQVGLIPANGPFPEYIISNKQLKLRPDKRIADSLFLFYYFACPEMVKHILSIAIGAAVPGINLGILKNLDVTLPPLPVQRQIVSVLSAYDDLIENNTRRIAILEEMAQAIYREWFVNFRFPGHEKVKLINSPLGKIPEGWKATTLGDEVELAYGKALKADDRKPGPFPVYGSGGVVGFHDEAYTKGPGIIVGRKGNVGSVFWSDDDFYPIDTVFFVDTKVPLHYVYYNLSLSQSFLNSDAAVPGLNRNQAYRNPFVLPSRDVLTSFEDQCNTLFSALRNLRKRNDNLRTTRDLLLPKLISGQLDVEELDIETGEPLVESEA